MKDAESQYCADDFRENNAKLNGKHEDYIAITIDDSPHGPGNERRDVLTGSKISVPGPPGVVINISPDEDEVTSSDRIQQEDTTPLQLLYMEVTMGGSGNL
ncbi:uncharacterized protein LOC143786111 [Ranitomeya variabilis]|uniref:uncharacterized protein LOC143786111 n=1 Tax=Ranitomeya variabilis TaxID=490064 RepID=UPI004056BF47